MSVHIYLYVHMYVYMYVCTCICLSFSLSLSLSVLLGCDSMHKPVIASLTLLWRLIAGFYLQLGS